MTQNKTPSNIKSQIEKIMKKIKRNDILFNSYWMKIKKDVHAYNGLNNLREEAVRLGIEEGIKIGEQNKEDKICCVCQSKFNEPDVCTDCLRISKLANEIRKEEEPEQEVFGLGG